MFDIVNCTQLAYIRNKLLFYFVYPHKISWIQAILFYKLFRFIFFIKLKILDQYSAIDKPLFERCYIFFTNFKFFTPKFEIVKPVTLLSFLTKFSSNGKLLTPENLSLPMGTNAISLSLVWVMVNLSPASWILYSVARSSLL